MPPKVYVALPVSPTKVRKICVNTNMSMQIFSFLKEDFYDFLYFFFFFKKDHHNVSTER